MTIKPVWKVILAFTIIHGIVNNVFADTIDNPCTGNSELLNIIDRPTVGDSACVVPFSKAVLELGYQYQQLTHSAGHEQNFPEAEFRLGLPANNEFVLLLPNYIHQSMTPHSGYTATTFGIKHEIGYNQNWLATGEVLLTLPTGSTAFGSKGLGAALNGIVSYTFNPEFNLSFMLGATTETQSSYDGGRHFTSINPDLVFTYSANEKLDFYGEIYGQSKTGPGEGNGFNFDGGVIYLLIPSLAVDLEFGQRINGNLSGFNHYIGTGMAIMF
jgi:hypothetical protein